MQVIYDATKQRIPIKMWLENIEDSTMAQIMNLANLPFAFNHIAIMPDAHTGYGMPIGGVLATQEYVIPNAVGVDIGCGMCAVSTSLTELSVENLKEIMSKIRKVVPVGFNRHKEKQSVTLLPERIDSVVVSREYGSALNQVGTLGGGNHFIEIQKGSDGHIWIMIHSGSRNIGLQVAKHYNDIAIELNEKYHSVVDTKQELAFLYIYSQEGQNYLKEMQYCVDFALANRKLMMNNIQQCFPSGIEFAPMINIAHNYATMEHHFGSEVMIHRKGATLARQGTVGIIPGSQGTKSYIVEGLGNPESFNSCSHGAGRKMGRKQAERELNLEEEQKRLNDQGIVHSVRTKSDLDEASGAYKSIEEVMYNQKDLVKVLVELTPLGVIKG